MGTFKDMANGLTETIGANLPHVYRQFGRRAISAGGDPVEQRGAVSGLRRTVYGNIVGLQSESVKNLAMNSDAVGVLDVRTITSTSDTITPVDNVIIADTTAAGGAITLTLPDAPDAYNMGRSMGYHIRSVGSSTVTLNPGSSTVDSESSLEMAVGASRLVVTDGTNWFTFIVDPGEGSVFGLPFSGPLGDGRHGDLTISSNVTATESIPMYQLTSLNVESGNTWTAKQMNPGGFFISVTGTCTIDGTIDVDGLGVDGGAQTTTTTNGMTGASGMNYAGSGGGGGAGSAAASSSAGGHGGPIRAEDVYPVLFDGGLRRTSDDNWFGDSGTAGQTEVDHRRYSGSRYIVLGGRGGLSGGGDSSSGTDFAGALGDQFFPVSWLMNRGQLIGFGSGGGSGGMDNSDSGSEGGAGGAGGGFVVIMCDTLDFTGTINARGIDGTAATINGSGSAGGGGGGGGGFVLIGYRTLVANTGTINIDGGAAGSSSTGGNAVGSAGGDGFSSVFDMRI